MSFTINFPSYGTITASFATVADLRAIPTQQVVTDLHAIVTGRVTPDDGEGGIWSWIADNAAADDGIDTVAIAGLPTGRFVRVVKAIPSSLTIGDVTTGDAGSSASAIITGLAPDQTISLTIPRGDVGDVTPEAEAAKVAAEDAASIAEDAATTAGTAADSLTASLDEYGQAIQTTAPGSTIQPVVAGLDGRALVGFDTLTGDLVATGTFPGLVSAAPTIGSSDQPARQSAGNYNGFIVLGQSNGVGFGTTLITTAQPYFNKTFGSGPLSGKPGNTYAYGDTSPGTTTAVPLVEVHNASPSTYEGPCSRWANYYVTRSAERSGIAPADNVVFASNAAFAAQSIANLSTTQKIQKRTDHIEQAKALAVADGKTYQTSLALWVQGEANETAGTTRAAYATALNNYIAAFNTSATTNGNTKPVHFLIVQVGQSTTGAFDVQRADVDVVNSNPLAHWLLPMSVLAVLSNKADGAHMESLGVALMGCYAGRAAHQLLVEQRKPDCVWPLRATARGTKVRVKFRTPKPLALGATWVPLAQDFGFVIEDDTGVLTLSNIHIVDMDTVEITTNQTLGANPEIRYCLD
jgi:hypothetical protein